MVAALVCVVSFVVSGCQNEPGTRGSAVEEPAAVWGHVKAVAGSTITVSFGSKTAPERTTEADLKNIYRFKRVLPGVYEMTVSVDGPEQTCKPGEPCIGSARTAEVRTVEVKPGQTHRWDF